MSVQFWDDVHSLGKVAHIGNASYDDNINFMSIVGDINGQIQRARAIMEIGPGLGNFIKNVPCAWKAIIDISPVNVQKMAAYVNRAYLTGEPIGEQYDIVTCISVIQHCNYGQVDRILKTAGCIMRTGASMYVNAIVDSVDMGEQFNTVAGRHSHDINRFESMAKCHGLRIAHRYEYSVPNFKAWIARLEKVIQSE